MTIETNSHTAFPIQYKRMKTRHWKSRPTELVGQQDCNAIRKLIAMKVGKQNKARRIYTAERLDLLIPC